MAIYIASNVVFLSLLAKPMLKQLDRIKKKYGIFDCSKNYITTNNATDKGVKLEDKNAEN